MLVAQNFGQHIIDAMPNRFMKIHCTNKEHLRKFCLQVATQDKTLLNMRMLEEYASYPCKSQLLNVTKRP